MSFDQDTTTEQILEGIDLSGRRTLVTGASGGLGAETARALGSRGAEVTLAARNVAKAGEVAASIRQSTGNDKVDVGPPLELMDPDSIRSFAEQ